MLRPASSLHDVCAFPCEPLVLHRALLVAFDPSIDSRFIRAAPETTQSRGDARAGLVLASQPHAVDGEVSVSRHVRVEYLG